MDPESRDSACQINPHPFPCHLHYGMQVIVTVGLCLDVTGGADGSLDFNLPPFPANTVTPIEGRQQFGFKFSCDNRLNVMASFELWACTCRTDNYHFRVHYPIVQVFQYATPSQHSRWVMSIFLK